MASQMTRSRDLNLASFITKKERMYGCTSAADLSTGILPLFVCLLIVTLTSSTLVRVDCFSMPTPTPLSSTSSTAPPSSGDIDAVPVSSPKSMQFGKFLIPAESIFYTTKFSAAFVNLRPIVPGHVLVMPQRSVPHLADLPNDEYSDLWLTVRTVQSMLPQQYPNCTAFNVAVQDGQAAGQSVPHVHVHILPRTNGDFARNDDVYQELEDWAPRRETTTTVTTTGSSSLRDNRNAIHVPDDDDRKDRTSLQMAEEAAIYRRILLGVEEKRRSGKL